MQASYCTYGLRFRDSGVKKVLDIMGTRAVSVVKAQEDLESLRVQIEETKRNLAELEAQAVKIAHFIEMANVYAPSPDHPENAAPDNGNKSTRLRQAGDPPKNVRVAISILRERNQPMKTKELVDELAKRGITIGGKIPVTNLSSALSRFKDLLTADRSEGWSLNEWAQSDTEQHKQAAKVFYVVPNETSEPIETSTVKTVFI